MKDTKKNSEDASGQSRQEKIEEIRQLLDLFKVERFIYLSVTIISLVVLIASALILLFQPNSTPTAVIGMFGSSGGITYSTGRLLKMWSDAIRLLQPSSDPNADV